MKEKLLKAYRVMKNDIDMWFMAVARNDRPQSNKGFAVECIECIGKAEMLARILESDYGEDFSKDIEVMCKVKGLVSDITLLC